MNVHRPLGSAHSSPGNLYAPVCARFLTSHVKLDSDCTAYCAAIMATPYMQEWVTAAKAEPEEVLELDVEF
jgi:glutathione S-transferase